VLSYRHAFHAGNHADVLKHFVLQQVLAYTTQKDKAFWYIDTHAGAGQYALDSGYALQNAEYKQGIAKLLAAKNIPSELHAFVDLIRSLNPANQLNYYPGSPLIAQASLRKQDKMRLFELHPTDFKLLQQSLPHTQVSIEAQNGFNGLKALLPPPTRRAVVLIDPPYEDKQDYQYVVKALKDSLQRFATGTYIVWYPLLQRSEPLHMLEQLKKLQPSDWLNVSLSIQAPAIDGFGMFGSGMFIINPPWSLPQTLNNTMPFLQQLLALDEHAQYTLESHIS
jgi:23S rRNA (adenine2030-N6)-methyltransferase